MDLDELIDEVTAALSMLADGSGITLTAIDEPGGVVRVAGSRIALRRAITSLVDNALGHVEPGDARCRSSPAATATVAWCR